MKLHILSLAAVALGLTACSSEDTIGQDFLADTPINLNVSVDDPMTRAGYSSTALPEDFTLSVDHSENPGDKYNYSVYAQKEGNGWKTFNLDDSGHKTDEEITMLWANMTDKVSVLATNSCWPQEDQSTEEKLKASDKLFMPRTQVSPSSAGISVAFQHTMSKINLTIELGNEYEFTEDVSQKITNVRIDGSLLGAAFDHSTGEVFDPFGDPASIATLLTGTRPYKNEAGAIIRASASHEAILVPQTIAAGKFTVSFMVDGKSYEWTYDQALTLEPGKAYTLKLTAGSDKVQPASFSAAQWSAGNGENGQQKETD